CSNKFKYEQWAHNYEKIQGVFNDKIQLINKLTENVKSYTNTSTLISIFSPNANEKSIHDLNNENATFMWFQLLMEILLRMPQTMDAKNDMLDEARLFYKENDYELKIISEFDENYISNDAIRWYTRESFLYRLLNKALRT
ncbi:unnamed protein product, partial [Didymodactylos carnosus]